MEPGPKLQAISNEEMMQRLQSEDGLKIIESKNTEYYMSAPVDYEMFGNDDYVKNRLFGILDHTVEMCRKYLNGVYIIDNFEDHSVRRNFRKEMCSKYGEDLFIELRNRDKLRIISLAVVRNSIGSFSETLKMFVEGEEELVKLTPTISDIIALGKETDTYDLSDYDSHDLDGKLKVVSEVEDFCKRFLQLVTKK